MVLPSNPVYFTNFIYDQTSQSMFFFSVVFVYDKVCELMMLWQVNKTIPRDSALIWHYSLVFFVICILSVICSYLSGFAMAFWSSFYQKLKFSCTVLLDNSSFVVTGLWQLLTIFFIHAVILNMLNNWHFSSS